MSHGPKSYAPTQALQYPIAVAFLPLMETKSPLPLGARPVGSSRPETCVLVASSPVVTRGLPVIANTYL